MGNDSSRNRLIYLDYLRVIATIFVIVNHTANDGFSYVAATQPRWNIYNFYASVSRWPIGIFVMISGILFLGRDIDIKKIFSKYVLRIAVAFFAWKIIYAVYIALTTGAWSNAIDSFLTGPYHLWYLPMIIGIYICTPIFRLIAKDEKITKYYLVLAFIFTFVVPEVKSFSNVYMTGAVQTSTYFVANTASDMYMDLVMGYGFFYVLGYYLHNKEISLREELIWYALGVIGFVATVVLNGVAKVNTFYGSFTVNVCFEAVSLYVLFKCRLKECDFINKIILFLGKVSFGAYLVHVILLSVWGLYLHVSVESINPIISVPVIAAGTYLVASLVSFVLSKIPGVNKYLV